MELCSDDCNFVRPEPAQICNIQCGFELAVSCRMSAHFFVVHMTNRHSLNGVEFSADKHIAGGAKVISQHNKIPGLTDESVGICKYIDVGDNYPVILHCQSTKLRQL